VVASFRLGDCGRPRNVFHLDDKGRAYEFWGVAEDQASLNSFWMD
jgi:hypothetical protein